MKAYEANLEARQIVKTATGEAYKAHDDVAMLILIHVRNYLESIAREMLAE